MFPHHVQLLIEWIMLPGAMTALKIVPMNPVTLAEHTKELGLMLKTVDDDQKTCILTTGTKVRLKAV